MWWKIPQGYAYGDKYIGLNRTDTLKPHQFILLDPPEKEVTELAVGIKELDIAAPTIVSTIDLRK